MKLGEVVPVLLFLGRHPGAELGLLARAAPVLGQGPKGNE